MHCVYVCMHACMYACMCACVHACICVHVWPAQSLTQVYHTYPCAPPLCACPLHRQHTRARSQLRCATQQGPGEFVVGCLLSVVSTGHRRAVKGDKAHTPCDTVPTCTHINNMTSVMSEDIDASKKSMLKPQYWHNWFRLL